MESVIISNEPHIISQGLKRKIPKNWRAVHSPVSEFVKPWQRAVATLRYADDHEYNVIVAGTLAGEPVYIDSYKESKYLFHTDCFAYITTINGAYHIKFFKCVAHKKGMGTLLLYFAFKYIVKTELEGKNTSQIPVVLEPDYTMSDHGQFQGTKEEQNRKLIDYYAKLGFAPIEEAKATAKYGLGKYHKDRPAMENTIDLLLKKISEGSSGPPASAAAEATGSEGGAKQSRRRRYKHKQSRKKNKQLSTYNNIDK